MGLELWLVRLWFVFPIQWKTISVSPLNPENNDLFVPPSCGPGGVSVCACVRVFVLYMCALPGAVP